MDRTNGNHRNQSRVLVVLSFAAIYLIWGSTFLGIKYAIETLPPFLMAGTRFLIAGAILFTWAMFSRKTDRNALRSWAQWRRALIVGALLLLCGNGGVTWAEKYLASGLAALLVATEPLWIVILNSALEHRRPSGKVMAGLLIGLAGVALLVRDGLQLGSSSPTMNLAGVLVIGAASVAWAGGSIYSNRRPGGGGTLLAAAMQMLAGGSLLLLVGLASGETARLNLRAASWTSIGAFIYLTVFGGLLAFTAYSWLLRNVAPARVATYAYVNPVVAVLLGWLLASEPFTWSMLIATIVIVGSVALITSEYHGLT